MGGCAHGRAFAIGVMLWRRDPMPSKGEQLIGAIFYGGRSIESITTVSGTGDVTTS